MEYRSATKPLDEFEDKVIYQICNIDISGGVVTNNLIIPNLDFRHLPNEHDIIVFIDGTVYTFDAKNLEPGFYRSSLNSPWEFKNEDSPEWRPIPFANNLEAVAFKKQAKLLDFFQEKFKDEDGKTKIVPQVVSGIVVPDHADLTEVNNWNETTPTGARMPLLNLKDLKGYIEKDASSSDGVQKVQLKNIQFFDPGARSIPDLLNLDKPQSLKILPCSISSKIEVKERLTDVNWPVRREVYKGFHQDLEIDVRVEIFKDLNQKVKVGLKSQRKSLFEVSHPSILKQIENISLPWAEIWVSEFFSDYSLESVLHDLHGQWHLVRNLFKNVLETLDHCHSHRIFMRFLNPDCILLKDLKSGVIKIHGFIGAAYQAE